MVHKFCENHLAELYEVVKAGKIDEIEKIEHELSKAEECVACAYALKAKGEAKTVLLKYLNSEGFAVETSGKSGILSLLWFWGLRVLVPLVVFLISLILLKNYLHLALSFILILSFISSVIAFIVIDRAS